jgi:hypothetical protein
LTLNNQEVVELINSYEKESKALRTYIYKLVWHMRGGVTIDQGFELSFSDREIINQIIKENIEKTKESGLPFI